MLSNHTAVKKAFIVTLSCACLSLTACSKTGSWVTDAKLTTSNQNGDEYVQLSTQLNTGGIALIPITLPIVNPHNAAEVLGQISIHSGLGNGTSELEIAVNLSAVLSLPDGTSLGMLPNGTSIPVAGVDASHWLSLPVANSSSRLYLNLDSQNKKAVLGVAIGIDQLSIGVPANLLLPFSAKNVSGVAGIYTGAGKGQSGFALFADAGSLLSNKTTAKFMTKKSSELKIQRKLYELDMKKSVLRVK
jgi:hypothetical protein